MLSSFRNVGYILQTAYLSIFQKQTSIQKSVGKFSNSRYVHNDRIQITMKHFLQKETGVHVFALKIRSLRHQCQRFINCRVHCKRFDCSSPIQVTLLSQEDISVPVANETVHAIQALEYQQRFFRQEKHVPETLRRAFQMSQEQLRKKRFQKQLKNFTKKEKQNVP